MKIRTSTGAASLAIPVAACALAIFLLATMDVVMKALVLALGVYNTLLWRSLLAAIVSGIGWSAGSRSLPAIGVLRLHMLRAAVVCVVLVTFFWGLARVPLAEAIGLSFVAPLIALMMAAFLLGERIRREAVWASIAGIVGVTIIVLGQLGNSTYSDQAVFGSASILLSTGFYAYNLILARRQALLAKPIEIMFFQNVCLVVIFGLAAPWLLASVPAALWLALGGATALSLCGQYLMSWSYARAEAQYLIPLEYSAFVWAIVFGWFFFNETVTWTTLIGGFLIVGGCLLAARSNPGLAEPLEAGL